MAQYYPLHIGTDEFGKEIITTFSVDDTIPISILPFEFTKDTEEFLGNINGLTANSGILLKANSTSWILSEDAANTGSYLGSNLTWSIPPGSIIVNDEETNKNYTIKLYSEESSTNTYTSNTLYYNPFTKTLSSNTISANDLVISNTIISNGNVTINGNLLVKGNTTNIDVETVTVKDAFIELRTGNSIIPDDSGIQFNLSTNSSGYVTSSKTFKWNHIENRFQINNDENYANVAVNTDKLSTFANTSSAELQSIIIDSTGTGNLVFSNNAILQDPNVLGNLIVSGDLTVNGNNTTLNVNSLSVKDNIIEIRTGNNVAEGDGGIQVNLTTDANGTVKTSRSIQWNNLPGRFQLTNDGNTYSTIIVATDTASTSTVGIVQLNDTVTNNSTTLAATANAVYTLNNKLNTIKISGGTDVGNNLVNLVNPNEECFIKINANNSINTLNADNYRTAIGAGNSILVKKADGNSSIVLLNNNYTTPGTISSVGIKIALNDSVTSTSITEAATANAVYTVNVNAANASYLTTGTVSSARLGTGTANSNTYLAGNGTWSIPHGTLSIIDDISSNILYPMLSMANTGNILSANTSSSKLFFNAYTGILSVKEFSSLSDINLKDNIKPLEKSLQILNKINPVEFTWKDTNEKSFGVIAQELENILPELVIDENGHKNVKYQALMILMLSAIQELTKIIEEYKNGI